MINAKTKLCCIIGNPVEYSLSPIMHNAGYKALGINYVFTAFTVSDVKAAIYGLKALKVWGIVVTIPHKLEVLKYVDQMDNTVKKIGAANTIINDRGILKATNTDWIGALKALEEKTSLTKKSVALLGAGGAARALAYALKTKNADVSVFNRTMKRADSLVREFGLAASYRLDQKDKIYQSDIIINTTSVGMEPNDDSPVSIDCLKKDQVVFDAVYTPLKTKLIRYAKKVGAKVIYGDKMVLYGGLRQFELFTEKKAPFTVMKKALKQASRNQRLASS